MERVNYIFNKKLVLQRDSKMYKYVKLLERNDKLYGDKKMLERSNNKIIIEEISTNLLHWKLE